MWLAARAGKSRMKPAPWLATRVVKMELSCPLGIVRYPHAVIFTVKAYTYCPRLFGQDGGILAWLSFFFFSASLWKKKYIRKKKNLVNIAPFWPHAWPITHIYTLYGWTGPRWTGAFSLVPWTVRILLYWAGLFEAGLGVASILNSVL